MDSDKKALLSLTSTAEHVLTPVRLTARETISELFEFEVEAVATGAINAAGMLNKPACVAVNHGTKATRYFHGIVSRFGIIEQSGTVDTLYRMVLVPELAQTNIRSDCRLFFKKTAKDILTTIFSEAGVTKPEFRLYSTPPQRKVTVQYNETSLHFVTRLMEEEGWFYFFEHTSKGHTLVVTDGNSGFTTIPGATLQLGVGDVAEQLTEFRNGEAFAPGKVSLRDYDFEVPSKDLKGDQNTILKHGGADKRAVFHWPALTYDTSQAKDRAKRQMEAAEAAVSLVDAGGDMASLFAGGKFKLKEKGGAETPHVVRQITHFAEDHSGSRRGESASTYSNTFTAFANTVPWRQPMETARPRMEGLHSAIVLGKSGDEIHTDDLGRIKVRFWWDWRKDATADNSDWVRVVQPWTGNKWGGQFIPRVGTEVAVAFMDGDPDRPVVVGGLYNGDDKPIFPEAEKTKLGFRSRSTTKGGTSDFNEFSFDDDKGKEMLFLHAQKDMKTEVENDQKLTVDHDRTVTVKGKETVTVTGDQKVAIEQGNQSTELKLGDVSVKADLGSITLEAMNTITLKVGQSSVTLSQTGVEVKGMMITINGQIQTSVKGLMVTVDGTAMLTLKGAIAMIN